MSHNDESLIKRMEQKGKNVLSQGKVDDKGLTEEDTKRDNMERGEV